MEQFVQDLFQESPDLSTLTHAIVRKKYLAHVGKEILTKEEKEQLRGLIEKALLQIQIDDSGEEAVLTKSQPLATLGGQKRNLCVSDHSGDKEECKHEQKKRRTTKDSELCSDAEDSGIDSKKVRVTHSPKHAGKSSSSSDHEDSVAEGPTSAPGSRKQNMKNKTAPPSCRTKGEALSSPFSKGQRGRGEGDGSGSESEESTEEQENDAEEEVSKTRKATRGRKAVSEANPEKNLKQSKLQKKKGKKEGQRRKKGTESEEESETSETCGKRRAGGADSEEETVKGGGHKATIRRVQTPEEERKKGKKEGQRRKKGTESEEESEPSETCGMRRAGGADSEEEMVKGGGHKATIRREQRGRKTRAPSRHDSESSCTSRGKQQPQRKMSGYKHRKKDVSAEEQSESDSDQPGGRGQVKKEVHHTKTRRRSAAEWESGSDSEEEEVLKKQVRKQRTETAHDRGVSKKQQEERQKHRKPAKRQGGQQPKRRASKTKPGSATEEEKVSEQKRQGAWDSNSSENGPQAEADQRGGGTRQSRKKAATRDGSESSSEETPGVNRRQTRKAGKEVSGSTECDSEDSGSKSVERVKHRGTDKKGTPKPRRSSSKEELRSDSDKEEERSRSESEDSSRSPQQRQQGKGREHSSSAKGEDHPSIQRLKRYIRECGVRRNYKKLLMSCRSRKAQLEVLRQELESLGVKGTPSLAKCKALKKKREEAAEVASLDLRNIISTEGRPRRRNVWSLYSKPEEPTRSPEGSPIRRRATDWSHLRGVISSDDESS